MSTSNEQKAESPYHHGDLRRALVTAAAELVSCCGPAAVSLREVARMVGVSHNAPYRHFPTRAALLAAVAAYGFEMLCEAMSKISDNPDPGERLAAMGRTYVAFALRHKGIYQLMFSDEIEKSAHPELRAISQQAFDALERRVMALAPDIPVMLATLTVWGLVHGIAHLILDNQLKHHEDDPEYSVLMEAAHRILIAGLSTVHAPALDPPNRFDC
jgi:AcrR family transcriptional regulator